MKFHATDRLYPALDFWNLFEYTVPTMQTFKNIYAKSFVFNAGMSEDRRMD